MLTIEKGIYGKHYRRGCLYFTHRYKNIISRGISYFTSDHSEEPPTSHVGIVVGPGKGIGAHVGKGVQEENLNDYIEDPHMLIYFKEFRRQNKKYLDKMCDEAQRSIGKDYDKWLIVGLAIANFKVSKMLLPKKIRERIVKFFDDKDKNICNEFISLLAYKNFFLPKPKKNESPQKLAASPGLQDVTQPEIIKSL